MTVYRITELECDTYGCFNTYRDVGPAWEVRLAAAERGWRHQIKRARRDFCPDCADPTMANDVRTDRIRTRTS